MMKNRMDMNGKGAESPMPATRDEILEAVYAVLVKVEANAEAIEALAQARLPTKAKREPALEKPKLSYPDVPEGSYWQTKSGRPVLALFSEGYSTYTMGRTDLTRWMQRFIAQLPHWPGGAPKYVRRIDRCSWTKNYAPMEPDAWMHEVVKGMDLAQAAALPQVLDVGELPPRDSCLLLLKRRQSAAAE